MAHANIFERRAFVRSLLEQGVDIRGAVRRLAAVRFGCTIAAIAADVIALTRVPGVPIYTSASVRRVVIERDGFVCQYCGSDRANSYIVEHVIPAALGGPALPFNLIVACQSCNLRKRRAVWVPRNLDAITAPCPEWRDRVCSLATGEPMSAPKKRRPGPAPRLDSPVKLTTVLTEGLRDRLFVWAAARGISAAEAIRRAVEALVTEKQP